MSAAEAMNGEAGVNVATEPAGFGTVSGSRASILNSPAVGASATSVIAVPGVAPAVFVCHCVI